MLTFADVWRMQAVRQHLAAARLARELAGNRVRARCLLSWCRLLRKRAFSQAAVAAAAAVHEVRVMRRLFSLQFLFVVCTTASLHQCALKIHRKNGMRLLSLSLYTHSSSSSSPLALVVVHLLLLTQLTRLGFSAFPLRIALM